MIKNNNLSSQLLTAIFFAAIILGAHQSTANSCDSINDQLSSKFRFLGSWNSKGVPQYLEAKGDVVSQALINYVNETLPESTRIPGNSDFFNDDVQLNTELKEASKVYLTMVHEGAGWTNTLGFYTYNLDNPPQTVYDIDSFVVILPNVTQPGVVKPGDKVFLGEFPAMTGIGYFLIAQGWVGDTICLKSHMVFTDKHLNTFTTAKYQQQTILLNYAPEEQILLGFEDQKRPGGDNDFNDAVFYITAAPGAIDTTNIPVIPTAYLTGDTTLCNTEVPAVLSVAFTGTAPFAIEYGNGIETLVIKNINEKQYSFETTLKGTIEIKKFSDAKNSGIPSGKAIIGISQLNAAISAAESACGDEDALVTIDLDGIGPWTVSYLFNNEPAIATSQEATLELAFGKNGIFELVSVKDALCETTIDGQVEVEIFEAPTATISGDTTICKDGEATIRVLLTGEAPFTFVYSNGESEVEVVTEESIFEFVTNEFKTYTLVNVTDAKCPGLIDGSATVSDGSENINVEIDTEDTSCFGEEIALALIGDTNGLSILWTTDGAGVFTNEDELATTYDPADNESGVVAFYAEVSNGCAVKTVSASVTIIENPDAGFMYSPNQNLLTNTQINFTPANSGYDEYLWEFGDGSTSTAVNASVEYATAGIYEVSLTVKKSGCEGSGVAELEVLSKDELYIPNAFYPHAMNPENQVVKVYGNNVSESGFVFKIVNRWGKVMYETKSFFEANTVGWAGVNKNTGDEQELNVFTYFVRGKFMEGESFERVGTITQVK
jgi:PKD repeat protein